MGNKASEDKAGDRFVAGDAAFGAAAAGWVSIGTTCLAAERQFHALVEKLIEDDIEVASSARKAYDAAHPLPRGEKTGAVAEWLRRRRAAELEAVASHVMEKGLLPPEPSSFKTLGVAFKALPTGSKVAVGAVVLGTGLGVASLARWWRGAGERTDGLSR